MKAKVIQKRGKGDKRTQKGHLEPGDSFTVRLPKDINKATLDYLSTCDNRNKRVLEAVEFLFIRANIDLPQLELLSKRISENKDISSSEVTVTLETEVCDEDRKVNTVIKSVKGKNSDVPKKISFDSIMSQFNK